MYDKAKIWVEGGAGGNGSISFRREAHVPRGGPDGGDGGHGGDVVLVCDSSRRDLGALRGSKHFRAQRGRHGEGSNRQGARGEDREIPVPPGTQATAVDGSAIDLVAAGQRAVVARGGRGGHGNRRFTSSTRQAPRFAEKGTAAEADWIELRLKLLADVGLVGLPNAGKSSLLSRLTRAAPKVADYPFTTLDPALGTIENDGRQLVLADIPGLIEGASEGAGLGHDFLAHVERTRLLVHVLDLAPLDGSDPLENWETVEGELARHDPRLASVPRIVALSKADLVSEQQAAAAAAAWRERLGGEPAAEPWDEPAADAVPVVVTSSATHAGLADLVREIFRRTPAEAPRPEEPEIAELAAHRTFRPAADRGWDVERLEDGGFRVAGPGIERLLARHDLDNEEALNYIEQRLRTLGVIDALEAQGFEPGDDVEIAGVAFELDPG